MISRDVARAIFKMVRRDKDQQNESDKVEHQSDTDYNDKSTNYQKSNSSRKKRKKHRHHSKKDKKHKKRKHKSRSRSSSRESSRERSENESVTGALEFAKKDAKGETNNFKENDQEIQEFAPSKNENSSAVIVEDQITGIKSHLTLISLPSESCSTANSRLLAEDHISKSPDNKQESASNPSNLSDLKSKDKRSRSQSLEGKVFKRSISRSRSRERKTNRHRNRSKERGSRRSISSERSKSRSRSTERKSYRSYERAKKNSRSPRRTASRRSRSRSYSPRCRSRSPKSKHRSRRRTPDHSRRRTPDRSRRKRSYSRSYSRSPIRSKRRHSRSSSSSPHYRRRSTSPYSSRYRSRRYQSRSYRSNRHSRSRSRDRRPSRNSRSRSSSPRKKDRTESLPSKKESQLSGLSVNAKLEANIVGTSNVEKGVSNLLSSQQKQVAKVSGGKTIAELTEFCKKLAEKKSEANQSVTGNNDEEVGDEKSVSHPFLVKPAPEIVIPKVILPVRLPTENDQNKPLQEKFPVSCGDKHREKETSDGGGSIVIGVDGTVPTTAPVFNDQPKEKIDISSMVVRRAEAQRRLDANPNDIEAMLVLQEVQMKMSSWCQSNLKPGQFTGQLVKNLLPKDTLQGGIQAWARKDMFQNLRPVTEGIGMKLLQKMGWKPGQVIGKRGEGYVEPIAVTVKVDRKGLISQGHEKTGGKRSQVTDVQGKHPVSALSEYCSKRRWQLPDYNLAFDHGPAHSKQFLYKVTVNGVDYQPAVVSGNKKHAKAQAAAVALKGLGLLPEDAQI